ncbi:MAG: radical SAM protein [Lachnospiraceae bacterium]|nr:radical SAM protein [Lachnospiraceae bacterium]
MMENNSLTRYSEITEKNRREIVLLRGSGCKWRRCTFCDYHLDFSLDEDSNFALNQEILKQVTGKYQKLEVINSGSFVDLDAKTISLILDTCIEKKITELHFECHWAHRDAVSALRRTFETHGIQVKLKIGVETFDSQYREQVLHKGIDETSPAKIAACFDEVCLLFGLDGQTEASMRYDIETSLANFERVCINIMVENTTSVRPNPSVIDVFIKKIYPLYKADERVDILLDNTDFGVG